MLLVIFAVGLVAGFVDAIAGGGGLIMLPGLLVSGLPVSSAIATNKLCGTCGAITSSLKFALDKQVDWRACSLMALPVLIGAYVGSRSIGLLPITWAEPIVIVLMIAITLFVVVKPSFGMADVMPPQRGDANAPKNEHLSPQQTTKRVGLSLLAGGVIGFHDGFFGPGTGVFLVFVLLSLWSQGFLRATGSAKVLNLLANATALVTFALAGNIDYSKGLSGALGVGIGSFVGATFATQKGAKLIKPIFVVVTTLLVVRLLLSYTAK